MEMVKFRALLFKYLPNEAHYAFFGRATGELSNAGSAVHTALGPLIAELNGWFAKETALVVWIRKSTLTDGIADANRRLDHALTGLAVQVRGARHNTDPAVSAAAEHLYIMLKSYGKVIDKPYLQEAGAVNAILGHLNGDLHADVQTAGLTAWVPEIQAAQNEFVRLFKEREVQSLGKPREKFSEVRRGIENVWHRIVMLVNAGAALNTSPEFAALINTLNPGINNLNSEFHRVRHNIAAAEPSPVERQACTGEPCTPVPEVLYATPGGALKLELGKDFDITYKNNVNPGNASYTLHGKGGYRGYKTVTFIITR
jgi:hypothetical protein